MEVPFDNQDDDDALIDAEEEAEEAADGILEDLVNLTDNGESPQASNQIRETDLLTGL